MELLVSVAEKLYDQVKTQFEKDIKTRGLKVPTTESPFWHIVYNGHSLFRELIGDFEPLFLRDKVKYKTDRHYDVEKKWVLNFGDPNMLGAFLQYLNYNGASVAEQLNAYLETVSEEERKFQHEHLNQPAYRKREATKPPEDIEELIEDHAKLWSRRNAPHLLRERFWLFIYGYDKFKGIQGKKRGTWPLVKLLFEFKEMVGYDIKVKVLNTGDKEHHDYAGKTDFSTSDRDVLVINCRTFPDFDRQLNIKVNIGKGNGDIFLGQYLNYETGGRIISGSLLMQRIPDTNDTLSPCVHRVPNLQPGTKVYKEDFEGVDKNILQYFHDKKRNFRRTSSRAGHTLVSLENWLESYYGSE